MRRFAPATLAASVALAIASTGAIAQTPLRVTPSTATGTGGSSVTTNSANSTTAPSNATGVGCVGTGGSTCTANTTTPTTPTANSTTTGANTTDASPTLAAGAPSSSPSVATSSGASSANAVAPIVTPVDQLPAEFRPEAAPTGAALGTSPGQTSSGTAAGNSSAGIAAGSENLGTGNPLGAATGALNAGVVVPGVGFAGGTGLAGATTDAGTGGVNANGERMAGGNAGAAVAANTARSPTPLFDLAARQGMAKEQQRRARGEEPRVYGIAPRTDRDLTHQMPDDPVIRY